VKQIITRDTINGISLPFEITHQITVVALGLEPLDVVTFWLVLQTTPLYNPCACPPGQVVLPAVLDEVQYRCCGVPIELTRANPFVVLDAPQGVTMRAKLVTLTPSTQVVSYQETTTLNVNDRLRGCPCGETP
jgi:hypothetical protein